MPNWRARYPEAECIANGDPYLTDIVQADEIIDDHRYNADLLGLTPAEAATVAAWVERQRLSYELAALFGWWSL